ncbi:ribbon-helix-helix domain-containing protein [Serratia marcescens]
MKKEKTYYVRVNEDKEKWIDEQVSTGKFKNASEVINHLLTVVMIKGL